MKIDFIPSVMLSCGVSATFSKDTGITLPQAALYGVGSAVLTQILQDECNIDPLSATAISSLTAGLFCRIFDPMRPKTLVNVAVLEFHKFGALLSVRIATPSLQENSSTNVTVLSDFSLRGPLASIGKA